MSIRAAVFPLPRAALLPEPAHLAARIPPGRLVQIAAGHAASAQTTAAVACLLSAQSRGETAAWVQARGGSLYPPDLADSGVDLDALVIVRVPEAAGPHGPFKAAEILLRSGGFGLVVVDCASSPPPPDLAWQSRLFALAREHGSWLLLLTPAGTRLGSLVALRVEPRRARLEHGRFAVQYRVHKDKTGLCASLAPDLHRGPHGLM
jgi:recombination protein RecA